MHPMMHNMSNYGTDDEEDNGNQKLEEGENITSTPHVLLNGLCG